MGSAKTVAVVGLGIIGGAIARNLVAAGFRVSGFDIDRELFPPALVAAAVQGLAFVMAHDQVAGFDTAQDEASAAVARLLDHLEERRMSRRAP